MRRSMCLCVAAVLLLCTGVLWAQAKPAEPRTMGNELDGLVKAVEGEFVSAAEAMPADKYSYAPTAGEFKGVRTFEQQVKHVAAVNYLIAAAILEEKPPVETGGENGPDALKTKAEIVKFTKDSFAYAHKAMLSITEANAMQTVKSPFGELTRVGLAPWIAAHSFDHYGQMAEYLRMNGIVPPASRPRK